MDRMIYVRDKAASIIDTENDTTAFDENLIITANPSKSGGDWWYGSLVSNGKSGVFPKTYVDVVNQSLFRLSVP
jgi:Variant SH3 domain